MLDFEESSEFIEGELLRRQAELEINEETLERLTTCNDDCFGTNDNDAYKCIHCNYISDTNYTCRLKEYRDNQLAVE